MARAKAKPKAAAPSPDVQGGAGEKQLVDAVIPAADATQAATAPTDSADAAVAAAVALPEVVAAAIHALANAAADDGLPEGEIEATAPEFPVVLKLTNAWPGRHEVAGTNESLAPGETRDVEFTTEAGLKRFSSQIAQLASLHGWTEGQGILVERGAENGED